MENEKLYIPYGLATQSEYFTGFGRAEIKQCTIGVVACGALGALLLLITGATASLIFCLLIGIAGSIMMCRKDVNTRISVVGQVGNMLQFARAQKHYRYVYKSSWL